jgi:hypothetical protein
MSAALFQGSEKAGAGRLRHFSKKLYTIKITNLAILPLAWRDRPIHESSLLLNDLLSIS